MWRPGVFTFLWTFVWAFIGFYCFLATLAFAKEEYDFSWLDPDKKIYVLQNRRYRKAEHPTFSILGGMGLSGAYRTTYDFEGRAAYYFTEALGVEALFNWNINRSNSTFDALNQASTGTLPTIREIKNQVAGLFQWAPWYAKINVFNAKLL